eukprot:scaffold41381_cov70-Phaeocystis_antarctica.AAC.2
MGPSINSKNTSFKFNRQRRPRSASPRRRRRSLGSKGAREAGPLRTAPRPAALAGARRARTCGRALPRRRC